MKHSVEKVGADWIAYSRSPSNASEQQQADAMTMLDLSREKPEFSWAVIKHVIGIYPEGELDVDYSNEARSVIGLVAAGPLEDLLQHHGPDFIERVEVEASADRRMRWALRGMYLTGMTTDVQERVRKAGLVQLPRPAPS